MENILRFKKEVKKNTSIGAVSLMEVIVYGVKNGKTIMFDDGDMITMPREKFNKKGFLWKNSRHNNKKTFTEFTLIK